MGKEFSSNVVVSSNTGIIGTGSVYGVMTVGLAAMEVKIGAEKLAGRKSVTLCAHPDNSGYIYLGLDNTVAVNKYMFVLPGGAGLNIELDSADDLDIFVIGSAANQGLGVLEGIS